MTADTTTKTRNRIDPDLNLAPPGKYQVVFMNDDVTRMDFVIAVLMEIFGHNEDSAQLLTVQIHEQGSAVVAVFPYEIAEQKAIETTLLARNNNFPLDVKVRAED